MTRWRCRNDRCERRIFAERLPALTAPFARRTARLAGIVRLFGHGAGGRPSERLMTRLGMPVSDTTILRDSDPTPIQSMSAWPESMIGLGERG